MLGRFFRAIAHFFSAFYKELRQQIVLALRIMRTREFWIYTAVVLLFILMTFAGIRLATGFDPLTRGQLRMQFACTSGQAQLATIIIGGFVFGLACFFTLGEVVYWIEDNRASKQRGREHYKPASVSRPLAYLAGTIVLGVSGYLLLLRWCT